MQVHVAQKLQKLIGILEKNVCVRNQKPLSELKEFVSELRYFEVDRLRGQNWDRFNFQAVIIIN